jgi:hypothetical protein
MIETLTREALSECLNTVFRVADETSGGFDLELTQVSERRAAQRQEGFSILFRGPADRFAPQRIYKLKHERLGEFDLFLVPVGKDGEAIMYEAVFNRLIPSA